MNNVDRNRINNYIYRHSIEDKEQNFNKLAHVINKKEDYVYKAILYVIDNCKVIKEDSGSITVEIDLLEHDYLLQVKVTYNIDKIYILKRIDKIINAYLQIKEHLQLCIEFGSENFWLYRFQIKRKKFSKTYLQYLRKFTIDGCYNICVRDLWN